MTDGSWHQCSESANHRGPAPLIRQADFLNPPRTPPNTLMTGGRAGGESVVCVCVCVRLKDGIVKQCICETDFLLMEA